MRVLDPELKSFVNINRLEDLAKLQTRPAHGNINKDLRATLGAPLVPEMKRLQEATVLVYEHRFAEASTIFSSCATEFEKQQSPFWGGLSREKEGETLLAWSQPQQQPEAAVELDSKGKDAFLAAATDYRLEAAIHLDGHCRFLAERAWADKALCESWVMGKTGHGDRYPQKS